ncbi:NUCLEOLAR PROTEIN 7/ESTROGEN RECEPTOR COACTIVATOR-RELATED [Salix koriyanagi]|uniref:NUCLEOLAR PROTEIN 7/ESTROGEN RECEPTOR COACTIVATOR-RELATED n=1 Tax=Salix koriyanagi TaxID=2511006 RepID=A0A9Q0P3S5_9ROSI|nr:NUCLEOLAR PROTEIN 7/ESTROGEN RECEPTOR COACTIVATOR-RELATED [Salix koriyanagi]
MGASSSKEQNVSSEQREVESLAASTGSTSLLQNAFSKLVDPQTNAIPLQSLQQCFSLNYKSTECEALKMPDSLLGLLNHLGPSIVDLFFITDKGGVNWIEFVRGYLKCCGRMPVSGLLNTLLRLFSATGVKAEIPLKLEVEAIDDGDYKINGSLLPIDVLMFHWMCWAMLWNSKTWNVFKEKECLYLPDISPLVLSAVVSCAEGGIGLEFLSMQDCKTALVRSKVHRSLQAHRLREISSEKAGNSRLLTCGKAWAISLTIRSTISQEILNPYFPSNSDASDENLIYRSSLHGKGLNRFWSNVEAYLGPLLILISATSGDANEDCTKSRKWVVGALIHQGFENRDMFYGTSGTLYAIDPVFHMCSPSGKEKNFVYSHLHPTGRAYEARPKPVGIAFGGTIGNERVYIDGDFARVTVRHHAVDKTYQPGSLFPNQGFLPVEALILEVEVWGLGGSKARETQLSYKKREDLFTAQRRKVDMKTFASWEDSPEKMMTDMMADPNRVRREDR